MALLRAGRRFDLGVVGPYDKFFFAILAEGEARRAAWALASEEQLRLGRPDYRTPERCLHISLVMIAFGFSVWEPLLVRAAEAADRIRMRNFRISLNRIESFRGAPRPRVLTGDEGVIGLDLLHAQLCAVLAAADFDVKRIANFNAHLTLMRDRRETPLQHVDPITWDAGEFVLVHSHHGQGRYTILERWPLASRG
ncbi:2'-5' RNA ligase family protein [Phenylobacterium sp.]|uniref:2'-5' RNA ligase family protein n=1 Tax=Phenylobacterium sp. TaxID=1871053 RepID=UPI002F420EA5